MGAYPKKPRRDRGKWSEWMLDECGQERAPLREPQLVLRLAASLGEFQEGLFDFESWNKKEALINQDSRQLERRR